MTEELQAETSTSARSSYQRTDRSSRGCSLMFQQTTKREDPSKPTSFGGGPRPIPSFHRVCERYLGGEVGRVHH